MTAVIVEQSLSAALEEEKRQAQRAHARHELRKRRAGHAAEWRARQMRERAARRRASTSARPLVAPLARTEETQRCAEDHGIYVYKAAHEEHTTRQLAARIVRALQEMTSPLDEAGASDGACHVDAAREAEERRLGALLADSLRR